VNLALIVWSFSVVVMVDPRSSFELLMKTVGSGPAPCTAVDDVLFSAGIAAYPISSQQDTHLVIGRRGI
jgi:hypothetical protein